MRRLDDARVPAAGRPAALTASRPQRGFGMLGAVVALAVLSILMGTIAARMLHDMRVRQGELIGQEMARMNSVVIDFTRRYHEEIKRRAFGMAAFSSSERQGEQDRAAQRLLDTIQPASPRKPHALQRLRIEKDDALRDLVFSVSARGVNVLPPLPDRHYVVHFDVSGPRCSATRLGHCAIDSTVYIDRPILRGGAETAVDHIRLNAALRQLGPGGGMSLPPSSHRITFAASNGDREHPPPYENPVGNQAGILLIDNLRRVEYLPFLRITGGEISGSIDMTRHDMENVRTLTAENIVLRDDEKSQKRKAITLAPGKLDLGDAAINSAGKIDADSLSARNTIATDGLLSGASIETSGTVHAEGDLSTRRSLILGTVVKGRPCEVNGALAAGTGPTLLQCRTGQWTEIGADAKTVAHEVRIIQRREEGRLEQQTLSIRVGPRYPLQYNYSSAAIEGEWDDCAIDYVDDLYDASLRYAQGTTRKRWWIRGQAPYAYIREMWGTAYVKCERRIFE